MRIITGIDFSDTIIDASIVTIGNFDGVHRGHAEIFAHLKAKSRERGLPSAVVTFEPHPLKVLAPESAPLLITTFEQKAALIAEAGIDNLVVVPFTREFSLMSAHDFVLGFLCSALGMRHIIIGHDYAFGRGRAGSYQTFESLGAQHGFSLEDIPPLGEQGVVFSSSLVRSAVAGCDMAGAARILGRYYRISGKVVHGHEIGTTLGFPTANISTANELVPSDGVYAVAVQVDGRLVEGACNIGFRPTFGRSERTIEVFLLDFSGTIYDCSVQVLFVKKIRPEQKFSDAAHLKSAIAQDVAAVRTVLEHVNVDLLKLESRSESCAR